MPVTSESLHGEELTTINLGKAGDALPAASKQENRDSQDCQKSPPLYRSLLQPDSHRLTNDRKLLGWQVSDTVFVGRTRINRESNVGVVFDLGDTTISIGHKGLFYSFVF